MCNLLGGGESLDWVCGIGKLYSFDRFGEFNGWSSFSVEPPN